MSETEKPKVRWNAHGPSPGTTTHAQGWRRVWNPDRLRWWWAGLKPALKRVAPGSGRRRLPHVFRSGTWMLFVWGILICLPIGGLILGYIRRPAAGTSGITSSTSTGGGSDSGDKIPKPAAGKPMLPTSQAPPPTVTSPAPSQIAPITPPSISTPQTPLPPASTPAPPAAVPAPPPSSPAANVSFAPVTYPARHDKHFGDECSGQLTLNGTGLYFSCPGNAGEAIQAAVNQIEAVDDNGVRLLSGKKYHFTIPGMSKDGERALFADWLNHVR